MADVREQILARLLVLAAGVSGINTTSRNLESAPADEAENYPAIIIQDGSEESLEDLAGSGRPSRTPLRISMAPRVVVMVAGKPEINGSTANTYRAAFLSAILTDSTMAGLTTFVSYQGCETQPNKSGRLAFFTVSMDINIHYALVPTDL